MNLNKLISCDNLKFLTIAVVTLVAANNNCINSTEMKQTNTIQQSNNPEMKKIINTVFKTDTYFSEYNLYNATSENAEMNCRQKLKDYAEKLAKAYDHFHSALPNIFANNSYLHDLYDVFLSMYNEMNWYYHNYWTHSEEQDYQANTYVKATQLLTYKKLFDACLSNNNYDNIVLTNEYLDTIDKYIVNNDLSEQYISFEYLLYYIRNKVLQLGTITLSNVKKDSDYKKEIILNVFNKIKEITNQIKSDIFGKNNVIAKQTNHIKNDSLYLSSLEQEVACSISSFYKKHHHELISYKVDDLHNTIINDLDTIFKDLKDDGTTIRCHRFWHLGYDILRQKNNITPKKNPKLNNVFPDGKEMLLFEYLQKAKEQLYLIKKVL